MLHPQAQRVLDATADDLSVVDPAFDLTRERERVRRANLKQPREAVASVEELRIGEARVRIYRSDRASGGRGVIVHVHGGGFVLNDIDVHDRICRMLANRAGASVVSVDYRRPPEHPFPAAVEDLDRVADWVAEWAAASGQGPIAIHGDSAGGNLALVAALRHRTTFAAAVLIYPFIDARMATPSYQSEQVGFDAAEARWYWEHYAGGPERLVELTDDPDFSPSLGDFTGLPPTLVVTAEHDILRDEGEQLVVDLAAAGVTVVGSRYLGMIHGFWRFVDHFDASEVLIGQVVGFLREHGIGG